MIKQPILVKGSLFDGEIYDTCEDVNGLVIGIHPKTSIGENEFIGFMKQMIHMYFEVKSYDKDKD